MVIWCFLDYFLLLHIHFFSPEILTNRKFEMQIVLLSLLINVSLFNTNMNFMLFIWYYLLHVYCMQKWQVLKALHGFEWEIAYNNITICYTYFVLTFVILQWLYFLNRLFYEHLCLAMSCSVDFYYKCFTVKSIFAFYYFLYCFKPIAVSRAGVAQSFSQLS